MRWLALFSLLGGCSLAIGPGDFTLEDAGSDADASGVDAEVMDSMIDSTVDQGPACTGACELPSAEASCAGGQCRIDACHPGRFDCNGVDADGCEAGDACAMPSVSVGGGHACALRGDTTVDCWGRNRSGQADPESRPRPALVTKLMNGPNAVRASAVATGSEHTCIIDLDGHVQCMGANDGNQLGHDEGVVLRHVESARGRFSDLEFTSLASRYTHTCAIDLDGEIWCWGTPRSATLASSADEGAVPIDAAGARFTAVATSVVSSCAITEGQNVVCWGRNTEGQLGNGGFDSSVAGPATVQGVGGAEALEGATSLRAGRLFYCAIATGGLACWGRLPGIGGGSSRVPTPRILAEEVSEVWIHDQTVCWRSNSETVTCRGNGRNGELGSGSAVSVSSENNIAGALEGMRGVTAHSFNACGYRDGELYCWGGAYQGITLRESLVEETPAPIVSEAGTPRTGLTQVSLSTTGGCAVRPSGGAECWGDGLGGVLGRGDGDFPSGVPVGVNLAAPLVAIARGGVSACAVNNSGLRELWCWGSDADGLSAGLAPNSTPAMIPGGLTLPGGETPRFFGVALGARHGCAVAGAANNAVTGNVACWGRNDRGQLGDTPHPTDVSAPTLVRPATVAEVRSVALGGAHTCAYQNTRRLRCWGRNAEGQLGRGLVSTSEGVDLVSLTPNAHGIAAGENHTCAIAGPDRSVYCWGSNAAGQVDGTLVEEVRATPVLVEGFLNEDVDSITAGARHTCASARGEVWCWGANDFFQHGNGTVDGPVVPERVAGLSGVLQVVSAPLGHATCAETAESTFCWGPNAFGQLGTDHELYAAPVPIPAAF